MAAMNLKRLWDVPRSVTIKGDESLLTQIDAENERILSEFLASETPDFGFLGEETGIHAARTSDAPYWYVDPVDGTSNMVHRFPWACVSIGLVVSGKPVVGVVNNPMQAHEFYAAEGMGAFLNDSPIHVSKNAEFSRALLATGFPVGPHPSGVFPNLKILAQFRCGHIRFVARGRLRSICARLRADGSMVSGKSISNRGYGCRNCHRSRGRRYRFGV